jgi:hypothetical protein
MLSPSSEVEVTRQISRVLIYHLKSKDRGKGVSQREYVNCIRTNREPSGRLQGVGLGMEWKNGPFKGPPEGFMFLLGADLCLYGYFTLIQAIIACSNPSHFIIHIQISFKGYITYKVKKSFLINLKIISRATEKL